MDAQSAIQRRTNSWKAAARKAGLGSSNVTERLQIDPAHRGYYRAIAEVFSLWNMETAQLQVSGVTTRV